MPIERNTRLRPGSIHPSLVTGGLVVDPETGVLSGQSLVDEDSALNTRIDNLYWKDPVNDLAAFENKAVGDFREGEAYFAKSENNIYIYIGDANIDSTDRSTYQPQSWIDTNLTEKFLIISAGIDASTWASKQYVDDEIANLIGGAPDVLNTLNDLVTAINNDPNFGATILADLADLEANKADKTEIYTQAEIDALEVELLAAIDSSTDKFSNVVDYVCGPDQDDDDQDFGQLWLAKRLEVSTATPKNFLLKQDIQSPQNQPIEIDRGGFNLLGFQPPEKEFRYSHIYNMIIRLSQNELEDPLPTLTFKNVSFNRLYVEPDSNAAVIIFNNCLFEQHELLPNAFECDKEDCILYFNNCQFYLDANPFRASGCKVYINNCKFEDATSGEVFSIANAQESFALNSEFIGRLQLTNSDFRIEKSKLVTTQNQPFVEVDENTVAVFQRITFSTPEVYDSFYFTGTGTAYFDYNIVDISLLPAPQDQSRVKQPIVDPDLNQGDGSDIYHFLDPLGSENFFYNDEKARDAIAAMFEQSVHASPVSFTYDDAANTLSVGLSLSTSDLADVDNIAFQNQENTFTQPNTFQANTTAGFITATTLSSTHVASTTMFAPNITTVTQAQENNSTLVATTAYVRQAISTLSQQIFNISVDELEDASITDPAPNQVLTYIGGADDNAVWQNATIESTWISDIGDFVKEGDSVFRLSKLDPPSPARQEGDGGFTGGYSASSQILAWNAEPVTLDNGQEGNGAYVPVLSNSVIEYATTRKVGSSYDGAGKVYLADTQEVLEGTVNNKAVVPSDLYSGYLRTDISNIPDTHKQLARDNLGIIDEFALHNMSNIPDEDKQTARTNLDINAEFARLDAINITDPDPIRTALGFALPSEPNILLESNDDSEFIGVKRALPYNDKIYIDFNQDPDNELVYQDSGGEKFYFVDPAGSVFINATTEVGEANYIILPTLNGGYDGLVNYPQFLNLPAETRIGPVVVRKANGSTLATGGALSLMCGSNDDIIVTADNINRESTNLPTFNQAQIDLHQAGHTVTLWPIIEDGDLYWFAEGYYFNGADQQQPAPVVTITTEVAQDVIEPFFDHNHHSPSLSIEYDDPNARLILTQHFATQAQVNAGTVSDISIAPDTFKTYIDALALTFLEKDQNLADLEDASIARESLELGTLAVLDSGSLAGESVLNAQTLTDGFLSYDSASSGIKTQALPVASTVVTGIVDLATLRDFTHNEGPDKVVTVDHLHEALETDNPYVESLKSITNTTTYTPTNNATVDAEINRYYSISTQNGDVTFNLPEITTQPRGSIIKLKYRQQVASTERITVVPYLNQTIDGSTNSYILNVEGQFIIFLLGVSGWEIN